jgi:hypothetical protein
MKKENNKIKCGTCGKIMNNNVFNFTGHGGSSKKYVKKVFYILQSLQM